ncbi:MAG TPA: hypothetical protein PLK94_10265 [Alphaproteobacteria bacterium]|nr:hypothetical protein [Alphaproteobacteria bacterium]HOO51657.1 hypothetical protein [Alphaproteobacteria bacterium]
MDDQRVHALLAFVRAARADFTSPATDFFSTLTLDLSTLQQAVAHAELPYALKTRWGGGSNFRIQIVKYHGEDKSVLQEWHLSQKGDMYSDIPQYVEFDGMSFQTEAELADLLVRVFDKIQDKLPYELERKLLDDQFICRTDEIDATLPPEHDDKGAAIEAANAEIAQMMGIGALQSPWYQPV